MTPRRTIDFYGDYFMNILGPLDKKVKLKINETLFLISHAEWVPEKHLEYSGIFYNMTGDICWMIPEYSGKY